MAERDKLHRKVWVLPNILCDRVRKFQHDQGLPSEVAAARQLLDEALSPGGVPLHIREAIATLTADQKKYLAGMLQPPPAPPMSEGQESA